MEAIPSLTKKIAGKSLPIEKLASRKARKFHSQGNRLFLPAMELAYVFGSLSHTPRRSLLQTLLPRIDKMLAKLEGVEPEAYGNGHEYWDGESPTPLLLSEPEPEAEEKLADVPVRLHTWSFPPGCGTVYCPIPTARGVRVGKDQDRGRAHRRGNRRGCRARL